MPIGRSDSCCPLSLQAQCGLDEEEPHRHVGHGGEYVGQPQQFQVALQRRDRFGFVKDSTRAGSFPCFDKLLCLAAGLVGIVDIGIEFDGQPARVAASGNFPQNGREVNRPPAGNHVAMLARRGDVFQVVMLRMRGHPCDPVLRILAHAVGVADIEIQP